MNNMQLTATGWNSIGEFVSRNDGFVKRIFLESMVSQNNFRGGNKYDLCVGSFS
jgi:hypothetical protein